MYAGQKDCRTTAVTNEHAKEVCVKVINAVLRDRKRLRVYGKKEVPTRKYRMLETKLQQLKENPEGMENDRILLLYERAEERYRTLESRDTEQRTAETEEILSGIQNAV